MFYNLDFPWLVQEGNRGYVLFEIYFPALFTVTIILLFQWCISAGPFRQVHLPADHIHAVFIRSFSVSFVSYAHLDALRWLWIHCIWSSKSSFKILRIYLRAGSINVLSLRTSNDLSHIMLITLRPMKQRILVFKIHSLRTCKLPFKYLKYENVESKRKIMRNRSKNQIDWMQCLQI